MIQKQLQPGSGAFTQSSLTCATLGKPQPERRSISISRLQGYGMRWQYYTNPACNEAEWRFRYVLGCSLDDSDKPVHLKGEERTRSNGLFQFHRIHKSGRPLRCCSFFQLKENQEGSGDLQEGHPSVTKGASPSAKHPLKVPFTKA